MHQRALHLCATVVRIASRAHGTPLVLERRASTFAMKQHSLPASYYRGGTSRAVLFQAKDLPKDKREWDVIFRGVIGSPDSNGRQLDGLGGGISSLSKVCVVGPSERADADVDYTFAAIGIKNYDVDYSSNCGNMTSAIGPFAVDSGIIEVTQDGYTTVRIHNTNSGKLIDSTFFVVGSEALADGKFAIDGVAGTAARIELAFINPAGSKTGKLLPTGNITDTFDGVEATCIDVGNPCVFIQAEDIQINGTMLPDTIDTHATLLPKLESIRQQASVAMGISEDAASTPGSIPKIAIVSQSRSHTLLSGNTIDENTIDLVVRALSVGQPHRAVPITVALAVAAAANIKGTTVFKNVSSERVSADGITLGHPSGTIMVGAQYDESGFLTHGTVFRTARRLMEGNVYWK